MTQLPIIDGLGTIRYINMGLNASGIMMSSNVAYATTVTGSSIPILVNSSGLLVVSNTVTDNIIKLTNLDIFENMLMELRKIHTQLAILTDNELTPEDVCDY